MNAAYTYTNPDMRRSTVRDRDFFQTPFTSPHQFFDGGYATSGPRLDLRRRPLDRQQPRLAIFSTRAFLFAGPRKLDLVANYTVPLRDRRALRFYGKVSNILDSEYLEGGWRVPGRWGIGGISFEF